MHDQEILQHSSHDITPARWRKRLLLAALAILILCFAGPAVYLVLTANSRLEEAIAEADSKDPGWQLYELEDKRLRIPDEENSALTLMAALKLMPPRWPYWAYRKDPDNPTRTPEELADLEESFGSVEPRQQLDAQQVKEIRREMNRAAAALVEARKVANKPRGRHPINYSPDLISTNLSNTQNARDLATFLGYDVLFRAQEQNFDEALASCRAILNLSKSIGDEPTLISMLVRIAIDHVAMKKIERVFAQGEPSEAALAAVQRHLQEQAKDPLLLIGARGERAMMDGLMRAIQGGLISYTQVQGLLGSRPGNVMAELKDIEFMLMPGSMKQNRAALLEYNNRFVEIAKLPAHEQRPLIQQLDATSRRLTGLAPAFASATASVAEAFYRDQALLRSAFVMVAAERYRRAHGQWPAALADLVPAYLDGVPLDPFDGKPLKFRRLVDGIVIYSVGEDGQDNGGNLDERPKQAGTDQGFRLWDVNKRRQPAQAPKKEN